MIYLRLSINREESNRPQEPQKFIDILPSDTFYVESTASFYKSNLIDSVFDYVGSIFRVFCRKIGKTLMHYSITNNFSTFAEKKSAVLIPYSAIFALIAWVVQGFTPSYAAQIYIFFFLLALLLFFFRASRQPLSRIRVYFIQPGESFPSSIDSRFVSDSVSHVYAIRLLSKNSNVKYRPSASTRHEVARPNSFTCESSFDGKIFSSIDQVEIRNRELSRFETDVLPDYWSLLYFSLAQQIDSTDGLRLGEVFRFSALLNRNRILFLLFLMLSLIVFSSLGLLVLGSDDIKDGIELKMAAKQGTLYMSCFAVFWAIYSIVNYRRDLDHVIAWERACIRKPFMHCPVFKAEPTMKAGTPWALIDGTTFGTPMASFGLDGERFLQVVLATIVIVFVMLVQLVK